MGGHAVARAAGEVERVLRGRVRARCGRFPLRAGGRGAVPADAAGAAHARGGRKGRSRAVPAKRDLRRAVRAVSDGVPVPDVVVPRLPARARLRDGQQLLRLMARGRGEGSCDRPRAGQPVRRRPLPDLPQGAAHVVDVGDGHVVDLRSLHRDDRARLFRAVVQHLQVRSRRADAREDPVVGAGERDTGERRLLVRREQADQAHQRERQRPWERRASR